MKVPLGVKPVVAKWEDTSTSTSSLVSIVKVPKIRRKKNHRKQKKPTEHINLIDFVSRALVDHKKSTVTSRVSKSRIPLRESKHIFPKFERFSVKTTDFAQRNAQNLYKQTCVQTYVKKSNVFLKPLLKYVQKPVVVS